jgi:hypothetical protein
MEYIATAINWVKANKKKTVVGLIFTTRHFGIR